MNGPRSGKIFGYMPFSYRSSSLKGPRSGKFFEDICIDLAYMLLYAIVYYDIYCARSARKIFQHFALSTLRKCDTTGWKSQNRRTLHFAPGL